MNFSFFSKKFFRSYTCNGYKLNKINMIRNNFRRAFLFNKVQLFNFNMMQTSSIIKNSLPFLSQNCISNTDNFETETKKQILLEGINITNNIQILGLNPETTNIDGM